MKCMYYNTETNFAIAIDSKINKKNSRHLNYISSSFVMFNDIFSIFLDISILFNILFVIL